MRGDPLQKHGYWRSEYTEYAAAMNVLLAYYNFLDDWQDEKKILEWQASRCLEKKCAAIATAYPRQSRAVRECLNHISRIEKENVPQPDAAAHWFGVLMGEIFCLREDEHSSSLRKLAYFLGKFIYMQDASIDLRNDIRRERYNPFVFVSQRDHRDFLTVLIAPGAEVLSALPLKKDRAILENIFYSGVWTRYELDQRKRAKKEEKRK